MISICLLTCLITIVFDYMFIPLQFLAQAGLYESEEEAAKRVEVLGEIGKVPVSFAPTGLLLVKNILF